MRTLAILFAAALAVACIAAFGVAQVPVEWPDDVVVVGPVHFAAATDTLSLSTTAKALPELGPDKVTLVPRYILQYAKKPFRTRFLSALGNETTHVAVDSLVQSGAVGNFAVKFPCYRLLKVAATTLYTTTASGDTVLTYIGYVAAKQ